MCTSKATDEIQAVNKRENELFLFKLSHGLNPIFRICNKYFICLLNLKRRYRCFLKFKLGAQEIGIVIIRVQASPAAGERERVTDQKEREKTGELVFFPVHKCSHLNE